MYYLFLNYRHKRNASLFTICMVMEFLLFIEFIRLKLAYIWMIPLQYLISSD